MTKTDEKILTYLRPYNMDWSDTYLCHIYYKNKDDFMYTVSDKVKVWVEKNDGKFQMVSDDKKIIGEKKGFIVRIIFPCYGKRDMKNIMAT